MVYQATHYVAHMLEHKATHSHSHTHSASNLDKENNHLEREVISGHSHKSLSVLKLILEKKQHSETVILDEIQDIDKQLSRNSYSSINTTVINLSTDNWRYFEKKYNVKRDFPLQPPQA